MNRRNIMGNEDMPAGALRQRRDLYAMAIGLTIYYLAGGELVESAQQGIIGMKLSRPWVILAAAWVGYFYFMVRLSLWKTFEEALSDFATEARQQALFARPLREALKSLLPEENRDSASVVQSIDAGYLPNYSFEEDGVAVNLKKFHWTIADQAEPAGGRTHHHAGVHKLPPEAQKAYKSQLRRAWFTAMFREHSFTNYLLPYCFALVPLFLGIYDLVGLFYQWASTSVLS